MLQFINFFQYIKTNTFDLIINLHFIQKKKKDSLFKGGFAKIKNGYN